MGSIIKDFNLSIYRNKNLAAPLTGVFYYFSLEKVVKIKILARSTSHSFERTYNNPKENIEIPIIGFRFDNTYELEVWTTFENNSIIKNYFNLITPEKPSENEEFPQLQIYSKPDKMEKGWIMFNPRRQIPSNLNEKERLSINEAALNYGLLIVVDESGNIVWFYKTNSRLTYCTIKDDKIYYGTAASIIYEIDYLGNILTSWHPKNRPSGKEFPLNSIPVEAQTFHHQFLILENGNILALSTEERLIENFFTSEDDANSPKATQYVIGDEIVEFTRSGNIVWRWNTFDYLDLNRIGYETFVKYWGRRGYNPDARDWTHFNGLFNLSDEDSVLVNSRTQSAVYKINKKSGKILWIFGNHEGFNNTDQKKMFKLLKGNWPWQQHSPYITKSGNLALFNNDNYRALPFNKMVQPKDINSRAVIFELDEINMTAKQIWDGSCISTEKICSTAMGSLEPLKENNILVNYGMLLDNRYISEMTWNTREKYPTWTMIQEVSLMYPSEVVFELKVIPSKDSSIGWQSFGAIKIYKIPGKVY